MRLALHDAVMRSRPAWRRPLLRVLGALRLRDAALANRHARRLLLAEDDAEFARILVSRPRPVNAGSDLELHMLLCERDLLRSLWALKSFFLHAGLDPRLVVHDDGSLSARSRDTLRAHFPGCEIPADARERAIRLLAPYPLCRFFRGRHPIAGKLLDVLLFSRGRYLLVMDSDVLWLRASPEVAACVAAARPFHLLSHSDAYARNRRFMEEELGLRPAAGVNSGLMGFVREEFLDLEFLESALDRLVNIPAGRLAASLGYRHDSKLPGYDPRDPVESIVWWVMEQTLYALLLGRDARRVALARRAGPGQTSHEFSLAPLGPETAVQHFVSDARWNAFFPIGVHHLIEQGFLAAWEAHPPAP